MAQSVTVFGGTGFLGRRIVRHLHDKGFAVRIASRHSKPSSGDDPQLQSIAADIHEERSIASAVAGAFGVVNAVSLYVERGKETFHAVHVAAAERLADEARKAGVERLLQISGIGADRAVGLTLHPRAWAGRGCGPRGLSCGHGDPAGGDVRSG